MSGNPRASIGAEANPSGAPSRRADAYTFARITLCGQTNEQFPHWMQMPASQAGTVAEMPRFSHCDVPLGKVPSTGNALTGRSSPRPASIADTTSLTNGGAPAATIGSRRLVPDALAGTGTSSSAASVRSTASKFFFTTSAALGAVGLLDRLLDLLDGGAARQHAGYGEEARLQHAVGVRAKTGVTRHLSRIDGPDAHRLGDDLILRGARQVFPDLARAVRAVEQQRGAVSRHVQHIQLLDELELMAADELRRPDQVGGPDRLGAEAQVRHGLRPGLLGVVDEVRLHVDVRILADDLDGVLVGAYRAVGAEPEEHRAEHVVRFGGERRVHRQARLRHVVGDADREVIARSRGGQFVEDRLRHGRREFLRRQAVAAADDARHGPVAGGCALGQRGDDVLVERFADRTWLLRAIEHGDGAHRRRQRGQQRVPTGNGRNRRTCTSPTRSPLVTRRSTASRAAPAPEPISTITRSASGAPAYSTRR